DDSDNRASNKKSKIDALQLNANDEQKLYALIELQKFDGYFEFVENMIKIPEMDRHDSIVGQVRPMVSRTCSEDVWTTLYVIAYLRTKMCAFRNEWEMIEDKAMRWLEGQHIGGDIANIIRQLQKLI
ncbi:hypothetical protein BC936DRAFT_144238, partial [Jimgerdemannia flammicorona]